MTETRFPMPLQPMSRISLYTIFTPEELADLVAAAQERGRSVRGLIHDAVLDNLASSPTWGNERP